MNNTIKGKITIPTIKGTIPGTSYTQSSSDYEVLTNKPQINGVELLGNKTTSDLGIESFSGDYNDLTNKPSIPSKTSELTNDTGYITTETDPVFSASAAKNITSTDITNWNNKSNFSGSYNDLTNKPTIPVVPTNISSFTNDSNYQNATQVQTAINNAIGTALGGSY